MSKKVYEEENIRAIADKIREKTGENTSYKVSEMPSGIDEVFEAGKSQGDGDNHYDTFWDIFQNHGKRKSYRNGMGGQGWTIENLKPKYDIVPYDAYMLFAETTIEDDLVEIINNCGIVLDFSNSTILQYTFFKSSFTRVGEINAIKCNELYGTFSTARKLKTIDKLVLREDGSNLFTGSTFGNCTALENITIEGIIGNDIQFHQSLLLTHDSLMSIINALKDNSAKQTLRCGDLPYSVDGYYDDPKGVDFKVLSAFLSDSTLTLNCCTDTQNDIIVKIFEVDISENIADIKGIRIEYVDFDEENETFIVDVVFNIHKTQVSRTLTLGDTNLAKLTDEEKAIAIDKGWILA